MRRNLLPLCFYVFFTMFASATTLPGSQISDEIYSQGIAHYAANNFRDAEFYLGQVLHDNPQHHMARYYLAAAMGAMGKAAQALPHAQFLLQIDPQNKLYQGLQQQLKNAVAAQPATQKAPAASAQTNRIEGDAYIPGIRKLTETGGGMVPLIATGAPQSPAPQLPAGYESIQEAVASPDPQVRRDAIRTLIDKKDAKLLPLLSWALKDQPCRELAGRALINLGDSGIDKIIDYCKNAENSSDKKFVYTLLGHSSNSKADKFIIAAWKQGEVAYMATLEAILAEKGKALLPEMIESLTHKNQNVRYSAAQIVSRIGEDAIPPLIDVVLKGKGDARVEAVAILDSLSRDTVFRKFPKEELEKLKNDDVAEVAAFANSLLPKQEVLDANGAPAIIP